MKARCESAFCGSCCRSSSESSVRKMELVVLVTGAFGEDRLKDLDVRLDARVAGLPETRRQSLIEVARCGVERAVQRARERRQRLGVLLVKAASNVDDVETRARTHLEAHLDGPHGHRQRQRRRPGFMSPGRQPFIVGDPRPVASPGPRARRGSTELWRRCRAGRACPRSVWRQRLGTPGQWPPLHRAHGPPPSAPARRWSRGARPRVSCRHGTRGHPPCAAARSRPSIGRPCSMWPG